MQNAPRPPGWTARSVASESKVKAGAGASGQSSRGEGTTKTKASLLKFLEVEERKDNEKRNARSSHLEWLQETELHRRSLRFERTAVAYRKGETAAQQRTADTIVEARNKKSTHV